MTNSLRLRLLLWLLLIRPMYDSGAIRQVVVSVGRTLRQRDATAAALWRPQMLHFAGIVAIAVVLVCVGLTFELRPLMRLAKDMLGRAPNVSLRVRADPLRNELRPIVTAFNQCLDIIERKTAMQRRFIADAAHQLRTPLTLLGTRSSERLHVRIGLRLRWAMERADEGWWFLCFSRPVEGESGLTFGEKHREAISRSARSIA